MQHLALLRDDADDAGADLHASADRLILVAAAGDDSQRLAAGLEQQNDRVVELEQLVHRPQRDVVDLVEVERRVDLGGHALQDLDLGRLPGELRDRRSSPVTRRSRSRESASVCRSSALEVGIGRAVT